MPEELIDLTDGNLFYSQMPQFRGDAFYGPSKSLQKVIVVQPSITPTASGQQETVLRPYPSGVPNMITTKGLRLLRSRVVVDSTPAC
jgi:hypothetical protein